MCVGARSRSMGVGLAVGVLALTALWGAAREASALCMARPHYWSQQREAMRAERSGRYDEAAAVYERIGGRGRYLASAMWTRAGMAALRTESFPQALSRFQRALQAMPSHPEHRLNVARGLAFAGRPVEALRALEGLPSTHAARPEAKAARSIALRQLGQRMEAARWAAEALAGALPALDRRLLARVGAGVRFFGPGSLDRL